VTVGTIGEPSSQATEASRAAAVGEETLEAGWRNLVPRPKERTERPEPRTVQNIEVFRCTFPLARPFPLGHSTIDRREYIVLRVTDSTGAEGTAFSLARGAPTDVVIAELIAPRWINEDISAIPAAMERARQRLQPLAAEGLVGRALSLLDIALWDLQGKHLGQPVWQLLGAKRATAPVQIVEGYPVEGETDQAFIDRILARVDQGYRYVKLAYGAKNPDAFTTRLEALMATIPDDVAVSVDVAWAWYDLDLARRLLERWNPLRLAWIEDPVSADDIETLASIRAMTPLPIGVGDEVARPAALIDAANSGLINVLRTDITCAGGFSRFTDLVSAAQGLTVSTHVYPQIHVHAALGVTARGPVEMFPAISPWDTCAEFVAPLSTAIEEGVQVVRAPTTPGLGLELDWQRIKSAAVRIAEIQG
jgi:L-alanine-DL-glutamate epimerase-like enolase superfamily enzyme